MNYTIIKHTQGDSGYDRCGDYYCNEGTFEHDVFRADGDDEEYMEQQFAKAWAMAELGEYDDLLILFNGIPETEWNDAEWEEYDRLSKLKDAELIILRAEREEAKRIQREKDAEAALQKARQIAAAERANDLAELQRLQRKLGVK